MPTLADIADLLNCARPVGSEGQTILGIAAPSEAETEHVTIVNSEQFIPQLSTSGAAVAIVPRRLKLPPELESRVLRVDDADLAVAKVLAFFAPPIPRPPAGVDSSARVAASASLGEGVAVGPFVVIGERARVGRGTVLHAGAFVGDDSTLGEDCELFPRVVVRERITLGNRVVIHAGAVLGTDGFGYRWDGSRHEKIPQIGTVVIEDDVEIGSCVCIDRAKFGATRVGRGAKIDNLVQIGHNVKIGPHCIIVGQAGVGGSSELGMGVVLGGQAAVRDHIKMGDGAIAAACSGVAEDVEPRQVVSGTPALPHRQSLREQGALRHLPELRNQVRKLQEQIEELKKRLPET